MCPFTDYISHIKNRQADNAENIDVVMPIYNLIEYKDNFSKTSGSLLQNYIMSLFLNHGTIADFTDRNTSNSFNFKEKITSQKNDTKVIETMVPLKYQSNFWSTVEIPLINCEINLI